MPEPDRPIRPIHARFDAGIATSKVVTTVFERILDSIHQGRLLPGERISDTSLAEEFGVSRTPVREALQRLREIGVVEASASRFTRVAVVSPRETAEAMVVWGALFGALLDEAIPLVTPDVVDAMTKDHEDFQEAVAKLRMQDIATTNFTFFSRLTALTSNDALRRAITSVVHIVRLGSLHLPESIDFEALSRAQSTLLNAARTRDTALAHDAMQAIRSIRIPLDHE
ncbi:DNA-binding GntR family transcriptional regulator [Cryobacterium mesophilum]|uniref:GntR family transcriptional regulator n=1 Tax=Terrimesophilobacter mesophilus TaxID=433647 RepID=A0A4R8VAK7_9MICO|nr:GntR family transcriptional regulator [Terrimesophilobacter mesophilus]MBB5633038.1 DNA-binding GntR family transcriptional regulator [Terrimesophilobacter mesophilus]TFB79803.1 GntR family transcriptional regulator [Terrimesophilobacter mesophilus]